MGVLIVCGLLVGLMSLTKQFFMNGNYQKKINPRIGIKNNGCSHSVWAACQTDVFDKAVFLCRQVEIAECCE